MGSPEMMAGGGAAVGATLGVTAAQKQNAAIEKAQKLSNKALGRRQQNINRRASAEEGSVQRFRQRQIGQIRTLGSAGGSGSDRSTLAIIQQSTIDAFRNLNVIDTNRRTDIIDARLANAANINRLSSQTQNLWAAGIGGATGGAQAGAAIGDLTGQIKWPSAGADGTGAGGGTLSSLSRSEIDFPFANGY